MGWFGMVPFPLPSPSDGFVPFSIPSRAGGAGSCRARSGGSWGRSGEVSLGIPREWGLGTDQRSREWGLGDAQGDARSIPVSPQVGPGALPAQPRPEDPGALPSRPRQEHPETPPAQPRHENPRALPSWLCPEDPGALPSQPHQDSQGLQSHPCQEHPGCGIALRSLQARVEELENQVGTEGSPGATCGTPGQEKGPRSPL